MDGNEEERTISSLSEAAESAECAGAAAGEEQTSRGREGGDGHDAASFASSGCAAVVVAAAEAAEAADAASSEEGQQDSRPARQGAPNRNSEGDCASGTANSAGTETETTTETDGASSSAGETKEDINASADTNTQEGAQIPSGTAAVAVAAAAAAASPAATTRDSGKNTSSSEINRLQKEKLQMLQYEAGPKIGYSNAIVDQEQNEQEQKAGEQKEEEGRGGDDNTSTMNQLNADDTFAENAASSKTRRLPPPSSTAPVELPRRLSAEDGPVIMRSVPSEPGAYHVRPISTASSSDRQRSSASPRRRSSRSTRASAQLAAVAENEEDDFEMVEMGSSSQDEREGEFGDDGVSAMTEDNMDSTAALTTIATPLHAHTYVEAIEIIPEETEDSYEMEKIAGKWRTAIVLAFLLAALALAIGLGVGLGRGGGDGTVIAPSTLVSDVPVLNTSQLVEVNLTFLSSSVSSVPPGRSDDPDSIILGLGASALVKGSPSAAEGGLVQVFDREKVEGGSNNDFVYNETLQTSPFTSKLPRGIAPEEVMVGPAFDSSGRIINVAVSFLGKEGSPGFIRVFERENGKGVLPNGREWWQIGQDVGLGLVNDFIDPQSDGFADGYGASVGYSPNVNGHLIVGSNAGFARLYFLQATTEATSRWVRIDANRIVSTSDATDDNPVIVASRNYRFAVGYPHEGAGRVSLFELIDPRTGEPFALNSSPLEPPRRPSFRQIGQTLKGLTPGDGFGGSISGDIAGRAWAIGCESGGGYVQTFRFNEERGMFEQFGNTLVGDPDDEGGFGRSLSLGYFAANAGACPTCEFQLDGLRLIVGSPFHNSDRGRAVVFEYSEMDSEWKRLPFMDGLSESERFGHSVSLSIEQSTVAVTYDAGSRTEDEPRGTGTHMWRIAKA